MAQSSDDKPAAKATNNFAFKLFQKLTTGNKEENVFFSPYSISAAMAMVLLGSRGPTQTQLKHALEYKNIDAAHQENKEIRECIQQIDEGCNLEIANRLFPEKSYDLVKDFLNSCQNFYGSEVTSLNYKAKAKESTKFINDWVTEQTAGKITNLLQPGSLNSMTKLVIANAVYFKGDWKEMFDKKATKKKEFHVSEKKKIKVDMMTRKTNYSYRNDKGLNAKILAVPYRGDKISMVIVLPNRKDGLDLVQIKLGQEDVCEVAQDPHLKQVKLCMPKFKLNFGMELVKAFKKIGVTDVFGDQADLSGISEKKDLCVSSFVHKAFVEVNEAGTEAAAATAVVIRTKSAKARRPQPPEFICDHPFLFFVIHVPTKVILFAGRCINPEA